MVDHDPAHAGLRYSSLALATLTATAFCAHLRMNPDPGVTIRAADGAVLWHGLARTRGERVSFDGFPATMKVYWSAAGDRRCALYLEKGDITEFVVYDALKCNAELQSDAGPPFWCFRETRFTHFGGTAIAPTPSLLLDGCSLPPSPPVRLCGPYLDQDDDVFSSPTHADWPDAGPFAPEVCVPAGPPLPSCSYRPLDALITGGASRVGLRAESTDAGWLICWAAPVCANLTIRWKPRCDWDYDRHFADPWRCAAARGGGGVWLSPCWDGGQRTDRLTPEQMEPGGICAENNDDGGASCAEWSSPPRAPLPPSDQYEAAPSRGGTPP